MARQPRWVELWPGIDEIPGEPGVYVVQANDSTPYCRRQVVYVGSAKNLQGRFHDHAFRMRGCGISTRWGHFADVVLKFRPMQTGWREFERRLIRRLRPFGNVVFLAGSKKSQRAIKTLPEEM